MGLRLGNKTVFLSELKDQVIALQYDSEVPDVKTEYGTVTVPRANILVLKEDNAGLAVSNQYQGLVFQRAIQNQIRGSKDWVVGRLIEEPAPRDDAPDATMYRLDEDGLKVEQIVAAFEAAHIEL